MTTQAQALQQAKEALQAYVDYAEGKETDEWFKLNNNAIRALAALATVSDAPPSPVSVQPSDEQMEKARDAVAEALGDAYDCTRVWSGWRYETMTQDDFSLVSDDSDRIAEITDAAIKAILATQPAQPISSDAQPVALTDDEIIAMSSRAGLPCFNDEHRKRSIRLVRDALAASPAPDARVPDIQTFARYSLSEYSRSHGDWSAPDHEMQEDDDGEFVKIGDVRALLADVRPSVPVSDDPTDDEQLIACLEDDAAKLWLTNPDDEMAVTMIQAAQRIAVSQRDAFNEDECRHAYENTFHKVRAEVTYDDWLFVWKKARALLSQPASVQGVVDISPEQEPKYGFRDGALYNRASGEAIPADEPIFIFRARDRKASLALSHYVSQCNDFEHQKAVMTRMRHFADFERAHPERMKEPDTSALLASQPAAPVQQEPPKVEQEPAAYLLEPIGRLSKLVDRQLHFDRPISGHDWNVIPLGPIASHPQAAPVVPDVDWLSNVIRMVDGEHKLGAGALAEKIVEAIAAAPSAPSVPDGLHALLNEIASFQELNEHNYNHADVAEINNWGVMVWERGEELRKAIAAAPPAAPKEPTI